jgi:glyoxalase/bleomycin resistance protein/dioxygenase superfamily protein
MISELFEVAIVVDDMGRAMREELAPLDPAEPSVSELVLWTPGGRREVSLNITYTRSGPVRLEVVEALPGTMWERPGVQHHGWFSDDLAGDSAALVQRGMPLIATRDGGETHPWQFAYHDCPPFGCIELVDAMMKPFLEGWWADGAAPRSLYPSGLSA